MTDMKDCARVVYFENNDEDYPYSSGGTCFLCEFESRFFAVTSFHVLRGRQAREVLIAGDRNGGDFLPIEQQYWNGPVQDGYTDFLILRIADNATGSDWKKQAITITEASVRSGRNSTALPSSRVRVVGYPNEIRSIDYQALRLKEKRLIADAVVVEAPASPTWLGKAIFETLDNLQSIKGMSGSPIFATHNSADSLAGLVVWGGWATAPFHYADVAVLWNVFKTIRANS